MDSGAGRSVQTLDRELRKIGVSSSIFSLPTNKYADTGNNWRKHGLKLFDRLRSETVFGTHNAKFNGFTLGATENWSKLDGFDIVHLHWMTGLSASYSDLVSLFERDHKFVWTLRDMWPITAGCHFSGNCIGFKSGCRTCPVLPSHHNLLGTSARNFRLKRQLLSKIDRIVTLSSNFKDRCDKAESLEGFEISVISNGIELDKFRNLKNSQFETPLACGSNDFVIGFGAADVIDPRKNGSHFLSIVNSLRGNPSVHYVVFGRNSKTWVKQNNIANCTALDFTSDSFELNRIYAACDVFVMPSISESFGKVTAEAMASGTPVIAYSGTPAEEIVEHNKSGWLAEFNDVDHLTRIASKVSKLTREELILIGQAARLRIQSRFSSIETAKRHEALYDSLSKW